MASDRPAPFRLKPEARDKLTAAFGPEQAEKLIAYLEAPAPDLAVYMRLFLLNLNAVLGEIVPDAATTPGALAAFGKMLASITEDTSRCELISLLQNAGEIISVVTDMHATQLALKYVD